jgi:dolichol-phosphate mannosyltransferase
MKHDQIAVIIPCYRVRQHILNVVSRIGSEVDYIFVVDDCCPEGTGDYVRSNCTDRRVTVIAHTENQGVGGAIMTGYDAAVHKGASILVKVDGDGQMDPRLIPLLVAPILSGEADYTKGNRFFNLEDVRSMPTIRIIGNLGLSFLTKLSSGYWQIFDPTNGFTALHSAVWGILPKQKIARRYFFESDMLFRLNINMCRVIDVPMAAIYENEVSNLRVGRAFSEFLLRNIANFYKRVAYKYFLRDFSIASIFLILSTFLILFGFLFGFYMWISFALLGEYASSGTVMISALPIVLGTQFGVAFFAYDIANVPPISLHRLLLGQFPLPLRGRNEVRSIPAKIGNAPDDSGT